MNDLNTERLIERFFSYVRINSQSDESTERCPTTRGQLELAQHLVGEMEEMGLQDISMDENGYVMATLPGSVQDDIPVIGFIAHLDTSPDASGEGVKPKIVLYEGQDILLNEKENIVLSASQFPMLVRYKGQQIITTDGTTLLGADDKAGVAEIMSAMEYLKNHPEIRHGRIRIAFTPDEEIGRGADHFDVGKFGAKFAYTMDGSGIGELEYENFNAARADIVVKGLNVHPGYAKDKMKNAMLIAMELNGMLPPSETPAHTDNYEGFYHLTEMKGTVEDATMNYIIRDHNRERFEERKALVERIVDHLNFVHGKGTVNLEMKDQYYNMREKVESEFYIVELALKAIEASGVKPRTIPIRGGTDGSRLSYMGLPCPNIFGGGHNFHSRFEFIPVPSMEKAVEVIVRISELNASPAS